MGKLFVVDSGHWRSGRPDWRKAFKQSHPSWGSTLGHIKADKVGRYKSWGGIAYTVGMAGLGFIPGASLLVGATELARIIQRYDKNFHLMHNELSEDAQRIMLLTHVENKILHGTLQDRQAGMKIGNELGRIAARLARQRQGPNRLPARQFLERWNTVKRAIQKNDHSFFERHRQNQSNVALHNVDVSKLPAHLQNRRLGILAPMPSARFAINASKPVSVTVSKPSGKVVEFKPKTRKDESLRRVA